MSALQYSTFDTDEASYVTYVGPDKPWVASSDHPNYDQIMKLLEKSKTEDVDPFRVSELFDIEALLARTFKRVSERLSVRGGEVYVDGEIVNDAISNQILRYLEEGNEDWEPLVKFYELLLTNPQEHSRTRLYDWLNAEDFTITDTGLIVGYKSVRKYVDDEGIVSYNSIHNGAGIVDNVEDDDETTPITQFIGSVVEMPRSQVTHDPGQDCAYGLHVGTHKYAKGFSGDTVLEVHVNPRNVVSVPDYDANKMRVCSYEVVGEVESKYTAPVVYTTPDPEPEELQVIDPVEDIPVPVDARPSKADFEKMIGRAKRRRRNFRKYAEKHGPWVFKGGDEKDRKNWSV